MTDFQELLYDCMKCLKQAIENARPGDRVTIPSGGYAGTWVRIEDGDPPYIENLWVEVNTGKICYHWSHLWSALKDKE